MNFRVFYPSCIRIRDIGSALVSYPGLLSMQEWKRFWGRSLQDLREKAKR
jgi:hypothetical protein